MVNAAHIVRALLAFEHLAGFSFEKVISEGKVES